MFAGMAAAAAGLVPPVSPAYDTVFSHMMPLAAALCLLEADLAECEPPVQWRPCRTPCSAWSRRLIGAGPCG